MLALSAFASTFGLIVTFGGIGVIVNVILIYVAIQVRGEHQQNEEYRAERQRFLAHPGVIARRRSLDHLPQHVTSHRR